MKTILLALVLVAASALLLAACGADVAKPTLSPASATGAAATPLLVTQAPTAIAATPTPAPTDTPALPTPETPAATPTPAPPTPETPAVTPAQSAGSTPFGACLEERLGPKAARDLVSGDRVETPEEEAVLEDCLLAVASGVSAQAISSAVATCFEEGLGAGVLEAVGSGARKLTAQEESVLGDCLLASTLDAASGDILPAVTACLGDKIGTETAQAIASGSRQLTADEEAALGDCVLASALGATTGKASPPVAVCLEDRLGKEAAQAIASGSRQLTAAEQTALGDCVLASALGATTSTVSPPVAACLEKRLGAEAAQAAASGSRELTAQESSALGGCLLEAALGAKP